MSPLKIKMLLELYCSAVPFDGMPARQVHAPAMIDAFAFFQVNHLLIPGVTHAEVVAAKPPKPGSLFRGWLSPKGEALVARLRAVDP